MQIRPLLRQVGGKGVAEHVHVFPVLVPDRQQVGVMPLVVFHEVAEMDFMDFEGGKAVPFLFQQFQAALRLGVFPFGIGMPHVHPAVTDAGVGRMAVAECPVACIRYPYAVRTAACLFVRGGASPLLQNLIHVAEFCFMPQR